MVLSKPFILAAILLLNMGCTTDPAPTEPVVQEEESAFETNPNEFLQANVNTHQATQLKLAMDYDKEVTFACANHFYGSTNQHAYMWLVCKRSDSTEKLALDAPVRVRYAISPIPAYVPKYDILEMEFPAEETYEADVSRLFPEEIREAVLAGLSAEEKAALVERIHFQ